MDIATIKAIIRRKPLFFLLVSLGYLMVTVILKWNIRPEWGTLWFLIGGIVGVYFLDIAEVFFHLTPSPFRTILFVGAFTIVSLFVTSSSGSHVASGLVLSVYLTLILWQIGEWQAQRNLTSWYRMIAGPVQLTTQLWILRGTVAVFILETFLFLRQA